MCNVEHNKKNHPKFLAKNPDYNKQHYLANIDKVRDRSSKWYRENVDRKKSHNKRYYLENTEKIKKYSRIYYYNNHEKYLQYFKEYNLINNEQQKLKSLLYRLRNPCVFENYRRNNMRKIAAYQVNRNRVKRNAKPIWYEDRMVGEIYNSARYLTELTGIQFTVDHIVPLVNSRVCGLHCLANLQILTRSENSSKGNRFVIE